MLRYNIILIFYLIIFARYLEAQEADSVKIRLNTDILSFKNDKDLFNASTGIYAIDISSGNILVDFNSQVSLIPASTIKIITTSAALEILGKGHRFQTIIQYDGDINSSGLLTGNIYIKGGGDPSLGSKSFSKSYYNPFFINQWVDAIKKAGIKSVSGSVIADASIFGENNISDTWTWGDIGNYYGTCVSGLSVFDNEYEVTLRSGTRPGDSTIIVKIEPELNNIKFYNNISSSADINDNSNIFGSKYDIKRYLTGTIPMNKKEYVIKGSLPEPEMILAKMLNDSLVKNNIQISNPPFSIYLKNQKSSVNQRKYICSTLSPSLDEIVNKTNTNSINLYAEILLKHIGLNYKTNIKGSDTDKLLDYWSKKGINPHGIFLNDGCGLSRYSGVTAKYLVDILIYMKTRSKYYQVFFNSLPVAGKSGSMKNIGRNTSADDNIHAKTGYITRVRSYCGYARTRTGKDIAFGIIVNNFYCTPSEMKKKIEKIMVDFTELSY
jgi:serine-type D-Ala-D-Ala carboxypeptidase/endopeptidase (penicillin-binding protein 4)